MKLVDALRQEDVLTENGMATNSSSLSAVVDLFYNIGAMRGQEKERLIANFSSAFAEDPNRAIKILFWARDVRGGAGERQVFKDIIQYLEKAHPESLSKNLKYISDFGRWDDLLVLEGTSLEKEAFDLIKKALLEDGNGLCAKWMPRKGVTAVKLRTHMGLTPKMYRKVLVALTNVVEQLMCAKRWEDIDFSKLPSLASARYQNAFMKNAKTQYEAYIAQLQKGEAKINAGAVYPYDVVKSLQSGNRNVAIEQWNALPNYLEGSSDMIFPMVDVSGSMETRAGKSSTITCMDVAVSLGLYISERNEGHFKDAFMTFSGNPQIQVLKGNLYERYTQLKRADWGMNTNVEKAFEVLLKQAIKHNVSQEEMPDKILILSDMQFDMATNKSFTYESSWNPTAQQTIEKMYTEAGYKVPGIIYWNIQSRHGDVPVSFDKIGTALISGFSPSIMTSILGAKDFNPVLIMDETIMKDRYSVINA